MSLDTRPGPGTNHGFVLSSFGLLEFRNSNQLKYGSNQRSCPYSLEHCSFSLTSVSTENSQVVPAIGGLPTLPVPK